MWITKESAAVGAFFALLLGFGVEVTDEKVPPAAPVVVHIPTKTYFAPICLNVAGLDRRQYRVVALETARSAKFKLDEGCRNSGAFSTQGTSAIKFLLIKLGLASYPRRWWDATAD